MHKQEAYNCGLCVKLDQNQTPICSNIVLLLSLSGIDCSAVHPLMHKVPSGGILGG